MKNRYAGGINLAFFAQHNFEENSDEQPADPEIICRNALRLLMMGWHDDWQKIISWRVLKAILIKRDVELVRTMRAMLQEGFLNIFTQLQDKELDELAINQVELYIKNCMSLLPYGDLNPYESVTLPQRINDKYVLVEYKVIPIELTPTKGIKKLFLNDEDRVFAYGLEPVSNENADPHLIFMGTSYPAGQGFVPQVKTDLESFATVGNELYRESREKIMYWVLRQGKKIQVCGTSLGGSLALLFAIDLGEYASRIDALNPAGLYPDQGKNDLDKWNTFINKPLVFIQKQAKDLVSRFGVWKKEWCLLHSVPSAEHQGPNCLADHAINYPAFADTQFTKINVQEDNESRKKRNFWLYGVSRSLFYYLVLIPIYYGLRPLINYALQHKLQLSLTVALTVLFLVFPVLSVGIFLPVLGSVALNLTNAFLSALIMGYWLDRLTSLVTDVATNKKESDFSRFLLWLYQQSPLIKSLLAIAIFALFFTTVSIVAFTPVAFYIMASLPLITYVAYNAWEAIKITLGFSEVTDAKCHSPQLPRNANLDIYNNEMDESFSYKELSIYYQIQRVFIKNKIFISSPFDTKKSKFDNLTKYEVLSRCTEKQFAEDKITLHTSKAKIHHMKHTIKQVNRSGLFYPSTQLINELKEDYETYLKGKAKY